MMELRSIRKRRAARVGGGVAAAALTFSLVTALPAESARSIQPPAWLACGTYYPRKISIYPPRVWSSYRTPERVLWMNQIQRWNGRAWYNYGSTWNFIAVFDYYGRSPTSWSGGYYHASKMNLPVSHPGYYRVAAAINGSQGGVRWAGFISNGAYCYMR